MAENKISNITLKSGFCSQQEWATDPDAVVLTVSTEIIQEATDAVKRMREKGVNQTSIAWAADYTLLDAEGDEFEPDFQLDGCYANVYSNGTIRFVFPFKGVGAGTEAWTPDKFSIPFLRTKAGMPADDALGSAQPSKAPSMELARQFMSDLLDATESLTGIADEHGARTLADLMHLQNAILNGTLMDLWPEESKVIDVAGALKHGDVWVTYFKLDTPSTPTSGA